MATGRLAIRARHVPGAPVVAVRVWVRGGCRHESIPGEALLAGRLLTEGTDRRDWRTIAEEGEDRGMSLSSFGDLEATGLSLDALAADGDLAIEWVAELVKRSAFPPDRCAWAVRQAQGELAALADHPDASTSWAFLDQLYAPHPAGRPAQGDADSLKTITPAVCRAFHRRALDAGLIVSVAGRVEPAEVEAKVRAAFAELEGEPVELSPPPAPQGAEPLREWRIGGDQAHVFLGHLTVTQNHPALPALRLLAVILGAGGGLSGRLPTRIREQEGLAYATWVDTAAGASLDPGRFVVYLGTSPESVDGALASVRDELERVLQEGVTAEEVEEARSYLLGREPFRRETARQWADLMAAAELYGLPVDDPRWVVERIEAVDRADVEEAARQFLRPGDLRITVGAPST